MEFEKTQDPSNPLYFFQHTQDKWVHYGNKWYAPDEWKKYIENKPIDPEVEWYYDVIELLQQWQEEIIIDPKPYLLQQYFELSILAIKHYRMKASWVPRKGMGYREEDLPK